jgi:hypothetical protein
MISRQMTAVVLCLLAATGFLVADSSTACAGLITFDEFPATNNGSPVTNEYAGVGVLFDTGNAGTWGGLANGDPGNWGVDGTNGPQFLGNNNTGAESFSFATGESTVSFDASRTNGSAAGQTLTANAYDASNSLVATETLTLGDINTWSTFSLAGAGIVLVDLIGSTNGFSPYGIDNLQFVAVARVPEPGSMAIVLGTGLLALAGVLCRSRSVRSPA